MILILIIALLASIVCAIYFKIKSDSVKEKHKSLHEMLTQQVRLTDAYAWQAESKRYELMEALASLRKMHDKAIALTGMLEVEVTKRAQALDLQNQKISEYHFINAHQLRAPVARILGLTSLLKQDIKGDEITLIVDRLRQAGLELDVIVHEIQKTLDGAEYKDVLKLA